MKTILPAALLRLFSFMLFLSLYVSSFSQAIPELVFNNPVLISGASCQNGAKYRFPNVTNGANGLDAIVEVKGRSASDVVLQCFDSSGVGWTKAFQPTIGIPNVGPGREWWVEFEMAFVAAGTNTGKTIDTFYVTSIDIDGDGGNLSEWAEMKKVKEVQFSTGSSLVSNLLTSVIDLLDLNNDGTDYRVNGPVTNYGAIDTGSAAVMATFKYVKKDKIRFRIGGKTGQGGGSSLQGSMRMNSLWFKQFSLATISTLPLNLLDFNATLNKTKVDLKWVTTNEKSLSHFDLERSTDGVNFSPAALVFAYGNTSENKTYSFSDNISNINAKVIYYRLRSVDDDGKSRLSQVRIIRVGKQNELLSLLVYPNPTGGELRVSLPTSWQNKEVLLEVFNQNGQRLRSYRNGNANQTEVVNVNDLSSGFYFLRASCDGDNAEQRFIRK